jgi:hypothetical protein
MKYYWSQFGGSSLGMASSIPLRAIGFDFYFTSSYEWVSRIPFVYLYILLSIIILRIYFSRNRLLVLPHDPAIFKKVALAFASLISVTGYMIVYRYDGVIQNWYTANLILPVWILGVGVVGYLQMLNPARTDLLTIVLSFITLSTFILNVFWMYPLQVHSPWPHQQVLLEAGKYLDVHAPDGRVGAWNAGVIGYYQGGTVVNIDGLVNDDIYRYAVSNSLPHYLEEKDIRYIVDFNVMFSSPFRERGGYDNPIFLQRLQPLKTFDQGEFPSWQFLTIYKISD